MGSCATVRNATSWQPSGRRTSHFSVVKSVSRTEGDSDRKPFGSSLSRWSYESSELRKEGQLARLLDKPLPGEPPAVLQQLCCEDHRQAEERLVALMRDGEVYYKRIDELTPEDRPARIAAKRLRTAWIKERLAERQEKWGGRGQGLLWEFRTASSNRFLFPGIASRGNPSPRQA